MWNVERINSVTWDWIKSVTWKSFNKSVFISDNRIILFLMESSYFLYEKLEVWQLSVTLVNKIYVLLHGFPNEEKFALTSQIRRAAISIPSNIAEGSGRFSNKEKVHFLDIAHGSLYELLCQMSISSKAGYIQEEDLISIKNDAIRIARMLGGLRRSYLHKMEDKPKDNE